jgi:hypothetical protein
MIGRPNLPPWLLLGKKAGVYPPSKACHTLPPMLVPSTCLYHPLVPVLSEIHLLVISRKASVSHTRQLFSFVLSRRKTFPDHTEPHAGVLFSSGDCVSRAASPREHSQQNQNFEIQPFCSCMSSRCPVVLVFRFSVDALKNLPDQIEPPADLEFLFIRRRCMR